MAQEKTRNSESAPEMNWESLHTIREPKLPKAFRRERALVRKLFQQSMQGQPSRIRKIHKVKPAHYVLCFACRRSFIPHEEVWGVEYIIPCGAPVLLVLCPTCATTLLRGNHEPHS